MKDKFWLIKVIAPAHHKSITVNLGIKSYRTLIIHLWEMLTFDLRHGITTRTIIPASELNFSNKETQSHAIRYRPMPVLCLKRGLKFLKSYLTEIDNVTFVDYGSGMGRVMLLAAEAGFQSVVGIELSPQLILSCEKNIEKFKIKYPNCTFTILNQDASTYRPKKNVCVFFFFNPFDNSIFKRVMNEIFESLNEYPRTIYCLTFQSNYNFSDYNLHLIGQETGVNIFSNKK